MVDGNRGPAAGRRRRIAILVDKVDWHARRLVKAFESLDAAPHCLSLKDCGFSTDAPHGLTLPGFDDGLPDGVFVRCVAGGSFEQVTRRLGILHALDALGVTVCNDARAIERCVDKSMTSFLLQRSGIPTPETWTFESIEQARALLDREAGPDRPLVLKPLFGSQGRGLRLLDGAAALPPAEEVADVFYLQRFVAAPEEGWRDWRILVAGGRPLAAMVRHGVQWITNMHQGARSEAAGLVEPLAGLAVAAARAVGAGFAGVDIIRDREGRHLVLEVNSMPAWSGLQKVTSLDLSRALAESFLASLPLAPVNREDMRAECKTGNL